MSERDDGNSPKSISLGDAMYPIAECSKTAVFYTRLPGRRPFWTFRFSVYGLRK